MKFSIIHYRFCRIVSLLLFLLAVCASSSIAQSKKQVLQYTISVPDPGSHSYHITLAANGWDKDTLLLKLPRWMPGYYQIIDYYKDITNMSLQVQNGKAVPVAKLNDNTWIVTGTRNKSFTVNYDVQTSKQFVANSYVDSAHAYIAPANTFLYMDGYLHTPVSVSIVRPPQWNKIATGLSPEQQKQDRFIAADFDILYDCPILIGNLEELTPFKVNGIEHRFIGYKMGDFDRELFMTNLKKMVEAGSGLIGDIPYDRYTFIAIGPGRGGIEHLNSTTVSFNGAELNNPRAMTRIMNFLAHEYYHHYNVKRIRPFELGPFDYDKGSKTNLLWVSEGLSVYYEYLVVKRAGLADEASLFAGFEKNITAVENNPGRAYQSLSQASYETWADGPFGTQGKEPGKSISYYDKGPVVGLLLDFEIRNATQNKASLDDVMRLLYWQYYKKLQRGFTDAEFQQACETVAGVSLAKLFEYVYTTKEPDYAKYLSYGGLQLSMVEKKAKLSRLSNLSPLQAAILKSWMGE